MMVMPMAGGPLLLTSTEPPSPPPMVSIVAVVVVPPVCEAEVFGGTIVVVLIGPFGVVVTIAALTIWCICSMAKTMKPSSAGGSVVGEFKVVMPFGAVVPWTVHDWPVVKVCEDRPGVPGATFTWQKTSPLQLVNTKVNPPLAVTVTVTSKSVPRMPATPLGTVTL